MILHDAVGAPHSPSPHARIVSLVPSITELLCDLGLAAQLVGRTGFCIHPAALVAPIPKVGGTKDVNIDKIRALAPTHLVVNIDENEKPTVAALAEFIPHVVVTHPLGPRDNLELARLLGGVFCADDAAAAWCARFEQEYAALRAMLPRLAAPHPLETFRMTLLTLSVNGKSVTRDVPPQTLLSEFIREGLRLTGTHVGCDTGQCGACTVHVDGRAVKACSMLAVQAAGRALTTIEGVAAPDGALHPMQTAFNQCHGLQCGFCTPGMVMSAIDLVQHHDCSSESKVREGLEGNMCRCTGYQNIVKAVRQGAAAMQQQQGATA